MPYVDGRRVASAVKADSPSTGVILLLAGGAVWSTKETSAHVDHVLSKPPDLSELREAVALCSAVEG